MTKNEEGRKNGFILYVNIFKGEFAVFDFRLTAVKKLGLVQDTVYKRLAKFGVFFGKDGTILLNVKMNIIKKGICK